MHQTTRLQRNTAKMGKLYFFYLFSMLFLQIIGMSNKGGFVDTVWKAGVIAVTMLFMLHRSRYAVARTLLIPLLLYLIGQALAISLYPAHYPAISTVARLINIAIITAMILLFFSAPHIAAEQDAEASFIWFLRAFSLLMLYAVIYNLIVNTDAVLGVLNNANVYEDMMSSFFDNKQTFGMFLLMACISTAFLYVMTNLHRYILLLLVFAVNLFLCLSRTALLAAIVFFLLSTALLFKRHNSYARLMIFFYFGALVLLLASSTLRFFISNVMLDTDATMETRQNIWAAAFSILKGRSLFFGYGESCSETLLQYLGTVRYTHNGIIQVLMTGGLFKLILYILIITRTLYSLKTIRRHNPSIAHLFLTTIISIMVYSMGESIVLFDTSSPCVAATTLCVGFPILLERHYVQKEEQEASLVE